ncbi:Pinin SDK protein [Rutstroemia sp. NJR-2017a BVV2]|nr:Pinin SDK protein [Rutstroemia sp. NJR-2017a BVV2]
MPAPVASAVVVPKSDAPAPRSPRRKRRQSSASEETSKRPRISPDPTSESPSTLRSSPHAVDPPKQDTSKPEPLGISAEGSKNVDAERRKSSVQEERKRGQRLFGGLLSTLNQSTTNGQQKRRQEIEARQKERAAQRKAEEANRKKESIAKLKAIRVVEQVKFEEQSYYLPWELTPNNKADIDAQIADTRALIEREETEWAERHPKQEDAEGGSEAKVVSPETMGEPHTESPSISNVVDSTNDNSEQATQSEQAKTENDMLEEHNGEVVVEAEEDTVIY